MSRLKCEGLFPGVDGKAAVRCPGWDEEHKIPYNDATHHVEGKNLCSYCFKVRAEALEAAALAATPPAPLEPVEPAQIKQPPQGQ